MKKEIMNTVSQIPKELYLAAVLLGWLAANVLLYVQEVL